MIDKAKINSEVKVKLKVVAGKTLLTLKQLSALQTGSILELDRNTDDLMDLYVNNVLVARGRLVVNNGELGISIVEVIDNEVQ